MVEVGTERKLTQYGVAAAFFWRDLRIISFAMQNKASTPLTSSNGEALATRGRKKSDTKLRECMLKQQR